MTSEMNRKRLVFGVGLFAAATGLVIGVRHCLHVMRGHGSVDQRRLPEACRPVDCIRRRDHDRDQDAGALAA
jgi:hypothetical protein